MRILAEIVELVTIKQVLNKDGTSLMAIVNSAIIVFREGLEAILILASLMGSLKRGTARSIRFPLWVGAVIALGMTILTWMLARGILTSLAHYGEYLEAVVSLIAISVLLLITNWFFHKVYWTNWIANFHAKKRRLLSAEVGQWIGLVALGITSIYREGFETILFLQTLVLGTNTMTVLSGTGLGLLGITIVGIIIFALQVKLPYKRVLIITGVMVGGVLLTMVGSTVQILQSIGWLPLHIMRVFQFPPWIELWFGLYPTWEGISLQIAAGVFVIGSYLLAEQRQRNRRRLSLRTEA